ncbi:MAG: cyclophilin-like fold protein, partial [candidate division WOR-3 bacterium]
ERERRNGIKRPPLDAGGKQMTKRIKIICGAVSLAAELNDTETAQAIWSALPISSEALRWGEEVYFMIPVRKKLESGARAEVEVGELGYWPTGPAFCVFFGPTPASKGQKPKAASPVTIIGKVKGDPTLLRAVKDGEKIVVMADENPRS